jgi:hypothetical protein
MRAAFFFTFRECMTRVLVFTDGSCLRNPGGPGAWAYYIIWHRRLDGESQGVLPAHQQHRGQESRGHQDPDLRAGTGRRAG